MTFNEAFFADTGLILIAISTLAYIFQSMLSAQGSWLLSTTGGTSLSSKVPSTVKILPSLLLALSTASLTISLVLRSISAGFFALSNMYEALIMTAIALIVAFLVVEYSFKVRNLGWAVCLVALIIIFYAGTLPTEINPLQAALRSYWRSIHVPPLLLAYGFFTLAFISSISCLLANRSGNPSLPAEEKGFSWGRELSRTELYDEVTYRCIAAGFPLMMIGVILGAVWANEAWGSYWSWDPKESMSLATIIVYGIYLHMRINGEHSQRTLAYVSVIGFIIMLITFVAVNMLGFGSLHSYA